jgi:hypothetical protein
MIIPTAFVPRRTEKVLKVIRPDAIEGNSIDWKLQDRTKDKQRSNEFINVISRKKDTIV